MKSIKKYLFYFIILVVGIFTYSGQVYAAESKWPGVSSSSLPGAYADMEYCVYNTGDVRRSESWNGKVSEWYSNTSYILIHDPNSGEIKFLNKDGNVKRAMESFVWDKSGNNQLIYFGSDLYDYLVDEKGILNCRNLYFVERPGSAWFSFSGSLGIYTPDKIAEDFPLAVTKDEYLQLIVNTGVTGTHFGETIATKCEDYYTRFNEIATHYYEDKEDSLDGLLEMTKSEFKQGDADKAKQYYDDFLSVYNQTKNDLDNLGLTTNENGDGFYINDCSGINNLAGDYNKLKNAVDAGFQVASSYYNQIKSNLTSAINSGATDLEEDATVMDEIKNDIEAAKTEWREYLEEINLGKEINNVSCEGLLGPDLLDDISTILTWVRIAVPIILIVLGSIDFASAVLSDDPKSLSKAGGRFVKRCIVAIAIFFVPSIIMYLLSFIDKIADVSCDIRLW